MTIQSPDSHRIFVFGSNLAGRHGRGAALHASCHYGAVEGEGWGKFGNSYALPTKDKNLKPLPYKVIDGYVQHFVAHVMKNPTQQYNVTKVGCGLAGYADYQIAPLFRAICGLAVWFDPTWKQYLAPDAKFWTHPI